MPVLFEQVARPIYYDDARALMAYDDTHIKTLFEGATAPQLYDRQPITLYYDENKCAVLSVINGSTMIYGE